MAEDLQQIISQVVTHLADVLAMTAGQPVRPLPAVGGGAVDWQVPIVVGGPLDTEVTLGMSADAAARLTGLVLMSEGEQADTDVVDTLKEIITQATAAYVNQAATGITLTVGTPVRQAATPPASAVQHDLVMNGDEPPRVAIWATSAPSTATAVSPTPPRAAAGPSASGAPPAATLTPGGRNLDVVLDLELPITVRFGATRLTLDALSRLGPGSLIDLERSPDEPVELLVNGRLVARGEVVVVSGCYGVRVRDVVSTADRLRSLEG